MIKKIAFVGMPTRDMPKTRAFYQNLLGLAPGPDYGDTWVELTTPEGKTIALDTYTPQMDQEARTYLALESDDIDAEIVRLKEAGVTIAKDVWTNEHEGKEVCKMALVLDPEGNVILLHQVAAWRTGG